MTTRGKRWRRYESLSISERYTVRPFQASVNVTVPPLAFISRQFGRALAVKV